MAGADRLVAALDHRAAFAVQRIAVQRRLEFVLQVILAALDLVDDRFLVAPGDRRLEILEPLVRLAEEGAVVFGIAAEAPNFGAEALHDLLALVGALAEDLPEAVVVDVLSALLITRDAVDRRGNERVEGTDCLGMFGHRLFSADVRIGSGEERSNARADAPCRCKICSRWSRIAVRWPTH